jgi:P27 family predicted phage terminase small subunit
MGKGRRPLPTAVKNLRGNPGHREQNDAEPVTAAEVPDMPPDLSLEAIAEWKSIVPILSDMRVLGRADGKALAAYCHAFALWMKAEKEIDKLGLMVEEPIMQGHGEMRELVGVKYKKNPALSIAFDALKIMKSYLVEFGMTPASRTKIRVEKPTEEDPYEKYLAGKAARSAEALAKSGVKPN